MELEESGSWTSDYTTKQQSSKPYGTGQGQKYISVEQDRKPRIQCTANSSMTMQARIYNGEKTACSISGAGKTGWPHV